MSNPNGFRPSRRALLASAAATAVCGGPALAQGTRHITIGGVPEESILPALWAERSGFFRRYGFDAGIDPQRSGSAVAAAVAGGAYAIGKSSIVSLVSAHSHHNVPFVIVAPGGLYETAHPNNALFVRADSAIRTGADLNGKTIAVSALNDLFTVSIRAWVDAHGGDNTTLKLIELPVDAVGGAIASGRVDASGGDAAVSAVPRTGLAHPRPSVRLDRAGLLLLRVVHDRGHSLRANRALVSGFVRAMRASATYVNGHPQQTIDVLSKFAGDRPDVIARMVRARMATSLDPRLLQPVVDHSASTRSFPPHSTRKSSARRIWASPWPPRATTPLTGIVRPGSRQFHGRSVLRDAARRSRRRRHQGGESGRRRCGAPHRAVSRR